MSDIPMPQQQPQQTQQQPAPQLGSTQSQQPPVSDPPVPQTQVSQQQFSQAQVPKPQLATDELEEVITLEKQVLEAPLPDDLKERTMVMINRLKKVARYGYFSREFDPVAKYVSWITQLPWRRYTIDNLELDNAKTQLDQTHYGLEAVKERILEYIAMLNLQRENEVSNFATGSAEGGQPNAGVQLASNAQPSAVAQHPEGAQVNVDAGTVANDHQLPNEGSDVSSTQISQRSPTEAVDEMARLQGSSSHAPIICLVGVQGIGKTSIAKSIAQAMGRRFIRVSLGGMAHVAELRGTSRSNVDSEPGQIIKALIRTDVMNPLILLDEVDKVSDFEGVRSDIMAALLEILDPEQNSTFRDNYIDFPVDLSKVMFIATANNLGGISAALLDRLEIIRMSSYTDNEKANIAKNYLLPKVIEGTGVKPEQVQFSDDVWPLLIRPLGFDAGIRQLERNITTIIRKVAKKIVEGKGTSFTVSPDNYREYLPQDFGIYS